MMNKPRVARPLGELVRPALADALKAQGLAAGDILRLWPEIAGERLAGATLPVRIVWPTRAKSAAPDAAPQPATLVLKVEGAFALEVEMASAQIVERINQMFGWRCIGRLRLRQGPVESARRRDHPVAAKLAGQAARQLAERLAGIEDEGLRSSLERLGREVMARNSVTRA
jgi:hypothetical protein